MTAWKQNSMMIRTNVRARETNESETDLRMFLSVGNLSRNSVKWKANKNGWYRVAMKASVPNSRQQTTSGLVKTLTRLEQMTTKYFVNLMNFICVLSEMMDSFSSQALFKYKGARLHRKNRTTNVLQTIMIIPVVWNMLLVYSTETEPSTPSAGLHNLLCSASEEVVQVPL